MPKFAAQLAPYANPDGAVPERINWRELLPNWRTLLAPGKDLKGVYELLVAISAPASGRSFYRTRSHPNGRKLFESKPDIVALLQDDEYLASLPAGSVGHAYRSFRATNRLELWLVNEAVIRRIAERNNWSEDYYYYVIRGAVLHDIMHTITGYGADAVGETLVLGFYCGQIDPAGPLRRVGIISSLITPGASIRHKLRCYQQATERGRRAGNFVAAPWEELLDQPLTAVRELLGIAPKSTAHPNGTWYTDWVPAGMNPPTRWDYDEILTQTG
jgi:ubiquinone biosynthesis protein COQ4